MKKRTKQLIIAAGLLAVLAAAFFIQSGIEKKKAEEEAAALEAKKAAREAENDYEFERFITFESEEIAKIEMISSEERAVLERDGEEWILTYPDYDVIQKSVTSAGNSVYGVGSSTVVEEKVADWSLYGIDDDSDRAVITNRDGESLTIYIGDKTPTGSGNYIRRNDEDKVYMAYSYSADNLKPNVDSWRNRELPQVNPQAVTYVKIEGEQTIELVPSYDTGDFARNMSTLMMVQPYEEVCPVSADKVGKYLEAMMSQPLTKISFVDDAAPKDLGFDNPTRLTLRDQENNSLTLIIGDPVSNETFVNKQEIEGQFGMAGYTQETPLGKVEYYARQEGYDEIFTVSGAWASLVEATPFELRDGFVRLVNIDDVEAWSFTYKGETWGGRIEREGEGDDVKETYFFNGFEAPEDDFKDIYQDILYIIYEGEIEEGPLRVTKRAPEVTLRYIGTKEKGSDTRADFYPYDDQFYSVSVDGKDMNFLVGRYQIDEIAKNMAAVDF